MGKMELQNWRARVWERDFEDAVFGPSGILKDEILETLASVGPILRLAELERVVGSQWAWFGKYGDELLAALAEIDMRPMQPKPPQIRGTKRPAAAQDMIEEGQKERTTKKSCLDIQDQASSAPTPVKSTGSLPSVFPTFVSPFHHALAHPTFLSTPLPSPSQVQPSSLPAAAFSAPFSTPPTRAHQSNFATNPYYSNLMNYPSVPSPYYSPFHYPLPALYPPNTSQFQWQSPPNLLNQPPPSYRTNTPMTPSDSHSNLPLRDSIRS